jgi:hypothetical protein
VRGRGQSSESEFGRRPGSSNRNLYRNANRKAEGIVVVRRVDGSDGDVSVTAGRCTGWQRRVMALRQTQCERVAPRAAARMNMFIETAMAVVAAASARLHDGVCLLLGETGGPGAGHGTAAPQWLEQTQMAVSGRPVHCNGEHERRYAGTVKGREAEREMW